MSGQERREKKKRGATPTRQARSLSADIAPHATRVSSSRVIWWQKQKQGNHVSGDELSWRAGSGIFYRDLRCRRHDGLGSRAQAYLTSISTPKLHSTHPYLTTRKTAKKKKARGVRGGRSVRAENARGVHPSLAAGLHLRQPIYGPDNFQLRVRCWLARGRA